jgi:uncharacterized protein YbjQ (UPF0145 family)
MKHVQIVILGVSLLTASGCAAYRTDSHISFSTTDIGAVKPDVPVGNYVDVSGKTVTKIGRVQAVVKKLTAFHSAPTIEQVHIVLGHKAKILGADAVINVTYESGLSWDSYGIMEAEGDAVKLEDNK